MEPNNQDDNHNPGELFSPGSPAQNAQPAPQPPAPQAPVAPAPTLQAPAPPLLSQSQSQPQPPVAPTTAPPPGGTPGQTTANRDPIAKRLNRSPGDPVSPITPGFQGSSHGSPALPGTTEPSFTEQTTHGAPPPGFSAVPPKRFGWMKVAIPLVVSAVVFGGGFLGYSMYQGRDLGPEGTFNAMLAKSLNTTTLSQEFSITAEGIEMNLYANSDYSDFLSWRTRGLLEMSVDYLVPVEIKSEMIFAGEDAYLKYNSVVVDVNGEIPQTQQFPEEAIEKWVKIDGDGQDATSVDAFGVTSFGETLSSIADPMLLGNFDSVHDREILEFMDQEEVYDYSVDETVEEESDGEDSYKYMIEVSGEKLKRMYQMIKDFEGFDEVISEKDIDEQADNSFEIWVSKKSKQLLKVQVEKDGAVLTLKYSNYGKKFDIQKPDSFLSVSEYEALIDSASQDQGSSAGDTDIQSRADDTEIRTDINSLATQLEVYYADSGGYLDGTTLGYEVSIQNLPGLDAEALISPRGSSLNAPGGYSYTPANCSDGYCESFTLYGTLADGTKYTKQSLN